MLATRNRQSAETSTGRGGRRASPQQGFAMREAGNYVNGDEDEEEQEYNEHHRDARQAGRDSPEDDDNDNDNDNDNDDEEEESDDERTPRGAKRRRSGNDRTPTARQGLRTKRTRLS